MVMLRVLIDWDYAADGIWLVRSVADTVEGSSVSRGSRRNDARAEPWSSLLSNSLVRDLVEWNGHGCQLDRLRAPDEVSTGERSRFYESARRLAVRVQTELGGSWQVLWAEGGAWHFVTPLGQHREEGDV